MTPELLAKALGLVSPTEFKRAQLWAAPITQACNERDITTPERLAAFLGQAGEETGLLTRLEENLNYRAEVLLEEWPNRFDAAAAAACAHNPQAIANRAYAGRMGNGDEASGDGWRFRGRGLFQLTGRADYRDCGLALQLALDALPDLVASQPLIAARSAAWEWRRAGGNALADAWNLEHLTRVINGGTNGLSIRVALSQAALPVLKAA